MAYIGREPVYGAFEKQSITPDSSTTTFSLNHVVGSSSSILVSLAGWFKNLRLHITYRVVEQI